MHVEQTTLIATTISMLAEATAVVFFIAMVAVWLAIGSGTI